MSNRWPFFSRSCSIAKDEFIKALRLLESTFLLLTIKFIFRSLEHLWDHRCPSFIADLGYGRSKERNFEEIWN